MNKELLLFQLGPVQEFIAQAETVGDLRVGSEILSELTAAALGVIPGYWTDAIFPAVEKDKLKGIPNRFLVYVPKGEGEMLAKKAVSAAKEHLVNEIAVAARKSLPAERLDEFDRQIEAFLQTTWAVLKNPTDNAGEDYKAIGKLMSMRRNVRNFNAWHEEDAGRVKDFLSGKEVALDVKNNTAPNKNSGRGAMNLIKKSRPNESNPLKGEKYIAIIAMDGDRMGAKLSGLISRDEHREFSKKLAEYAANVKISPEDGLLIYAGGDDVLAVVKAKRAFEIAEKLAKDFTATLNDNGSREVTASVGIAIGSTKAPLQDLIKEAQSAESRAKHGYGRDALSVSVLKRSGEILHWGCKWDSAALKIYRSFIREDGSFSRFAYKLAGFLEPYDLGRRNHEGKILVDWESMKGVVKAETMHAIEQTEGMNNVLSEKDIDDYLGDKMLETRPEDFLGLFLCETFITRPRD